MLGDVERAREMARHQEKLSKVEKLERLEKLERMERSEKHSVMRIRAGVDTMVLDGKEMEYMMEDDILVSHSACEIKRV